MTWQTLVERQPWIVFVLPMAVFLAIGALEPTPETQGGSAIGLAIPYTWYPWIYTLKLVATLAAMALVARGYRQFPLRIGPLALALGMVGAFVWIGLAELDLERAYLQPLLQRVRLGWLIDSGERSGFNPLEQLADQPAIAWAFLAVRFFGLVAVVPVIEEFFLRGFLMRLVVAEDWWNVPVGKANAAAVVLATVVPMLMHPGELLAAAAWFTMVTWLLLRTRNLWDCVAAHAVTNLLLGVYVVATGHWRLM